MSGRSAEPPADPRRGSGGLCGSDRACRELLGETDGDISTAGPHVGNPQSGVPAFLAKHVQRGDHDELGFRTRDQDVGADLELAGIKFPLAHQVSDRAAIDTLPDKLAKLVQDPLPRFLVKPRVEVDPLAAERVGQQDLGIQPGRAGSLAGKKVCRP